MTAWSRKRPALITTFLNPQVWLLTSALTVLIPQNCLRCESGPNIINTYLMLCNLLGKNIAHCGDHRSVHILHLLYHMNQFHQGDMDSYHPNFEQSNEGGFSTESQCDKPESTHSMRTKLQEIVQNKVIFQRWVTVATVQVSLAYVLNKRDLHIRKAKLKLYCSVGWASGYRAGGRRFKTPARPKLRVFEQLRRNCCLFNETCQWMDSNLFR
mgnify:FL=1